MWATLQSVESSTGVSSHCINDPFCQCCRLSKGRSLRDLMVVVREKALQMQQQGPEFNALKAWMWSLSLKTLLKLAQVCLLNCCV